MISRTYKKGDKVEYIANDPDIGTDAEIGMMYVITEVSRDDEEDGVPYEIRLLDDEWADTTWCDEDQIKLALNKKDAKGEMSCGQMIQPITQDAQNKEKVSFFKIANGVVVDENYEKSKDWSSKSKWFRVLTIDSFIEQSEKLINEKMTNWSKVSIIETSESYGDDDDSINEDDVDFGKPMYEAFIEDENEDYIEDTTTGRYCDIVSTVNELYGIVDDYINPTEDEVKTSCISIELLNATPLWVAGDAIRTCWQSGENSDKTLVSKCCGTTTEELDENDWVCKSCGMAQSDDSMELIAGPKDRALIERVGNKFKHASTLEHLSYNFYIKGISRALLQELARHRIASLSVKSTRYTLKELKSENVFVSNMMTKGWERMDNPFSTGSLWINKQRASKYLVQTGNEFVDNNGVLELQLLQNSLSKGISNDIAKYNLPESYKTELTWSINARSLQNFLSLRTDKAALWEIRDLANAVFNALPEDHKYLFQDFVKEA